MLSINTKQSFFENLEIAIQNDKQNIGYGLKQLCTKEFVSLFLPDEKMREKQERAWLKSIGNCIERQIEVSCDQIAFLAGITEAKMKELSDITEELIQIDITVQKKKKEQIITFKTLLKIIQTNILKTLNANSSVQNIQRDIDEKLKDFLSYQKKIKGELERIETCKRASGFVFDKKMGRGLESIIGKIKTLFKIQNTVTDIMQVDNIAIADIDSDLDIMLPPDSSEEIFVESLFEDVQISEWEIVDVPSLKGETSSYVSNICILPQTNGNFSKISLAHQFEEKVIEDSKVVLGENEKLKFHAKQWFSDKDCKELLMVKEHLYELDLNHSDLEDHGMKWIGKLQNLRILDLWGSKVGDKGLKYITKLKNIEKLHLSKTQITNVGMKSLARHKNLKELHLSGTNISSRGIKYIEKLTSLQKLNLSGTFIDSKAMDYIANFTKLLSLHLFHTKIDNFGLECIEHLTYLRKLDLEGTKVTTSGLRHLVNMKKLQELYLSGSSINNEGMRWVSRLPSLIKLSICNTNVNNDSIRWIKKLVNLKELNISKTQIDKAGEAMLRKTMPEIQITKDDNSFYA